MNIFVLDYDPRLAAKYHCDKHIVKMILESAQMLCTVHRELWGHDVPYKSTHRNHPCTKWIKESPANYWWLRLLSYHLNEEYKRRFKHTTNHKSYDVIDNLIIPSKRMFNVPIGLQQMMTPFALAMPDEYKSKDAVASYRAYYIGEKYDIAEYKYSEKPTWLRRN